LNMRKSLANSLEDGPSTEDSPVGPGHNSSASRGSARRHYADTPLSRFVAGKTFETLMSVVILLNCGTMGLEAHATVIDMGPYVNIFLLVAENAFTGMFTVELVLRFKVFGRRMFWPLSGESCWNIFDSILVIFTGILFVWVLPLCAMIFADLDFAGNSMIRVFTVFRAFRVIRLVRVVQQVQFFHEVWLLLRGLQSSARTLFWTVVVIFFLTYVFAIFGIVLIGKPLVDRFSEDGNDMQGEHYDLQRLVEVVGTLPDLMFTLIQVLNGDSWTAIVKAIQNYQPYAWIYFYLYVSVASLVLMNLVTAIIVEHALNTSKADEELQQASREKLYRLELNKLNSLFMMMDADGDGMLCWDEFQESFNDFEMQEKWRLLDFKQADCKELFHLLDTGDGNIDTDEFFAGLRRMKGVAQSRDLFRVMRSIDNLSHDFLYLRNSLPSRADDASRAPSEASRA